MIEIKAPHTYSQYKDKKSIFLAGSIEMGTAEDWQSKVCSLLEKQDILILNPRRDEWDSSWEQSIDNPKFREQVEWELQALEDAQHIIFYFSPGTKSPITLMELGIHAVKNPQKCIVVCPQGYWRKGNVDIVCNRYGVRQADTIESALTPVA